MRRAASENPQLFCNRHLSWLQFNRRVLEEALDTHNPVLERAKFLAITASDLDEFVEVRVAGLLQQAEQGKGEAGPDGLALGEALIQLGAAMHEFVKDQYHCWREKLLPAMAEESIRVRTFRQLNPLARRAVERFYLERVEPLMTPVTLDPAHPFPRVINKALCLALLLKRKRRGAGAQNSLLGVVTVPRALPRLIALPSGTGTHDFIFLHDLIEQNAAGMYRGYEILSKAAFR